MTSNIKGYLISCEGRQLFVRNFEDALWATEDSNYTVEALAPVSKDSALSSVEDSPQAKFDDYVKISSELYDLQQQHITHLQTRLEEAIELIESINEFSSKDTHNLLEAKGLLRVVAESCGKFLKAEDE